jgi:hypothetical protein
VLEEKSVEADELPDWKSGRALRRMVLIGAIFAKAILCWRLEDYGLEEEEEATHGLGWCD